jgi:FkbM family methyltransferase
VTGALGVKLRSRALLALMRAVPPDVLRTVHERRRFNPVGALLARGEVHVMGGLGVRMRMSAAHFPYWGAQAYGVLSGQHELMVQEALRRSLGPGGVLIDVGSNIGAIALLGARLVGPAGRVIALDAQRECVEATAANARLNGFDHLTAVHAAAAADSGETEVIVVADALWTRLASVGPHPLERRHDTVTAVALDDLVRRLALSRVDLIKIDVEGGELEVVAGMRRLLSMQRPTVVCEMHGTNVSFCEAMRDAGYRVTNLDGPEPVELAGENVHALAEPAGS